MISFNVGPSKLYPQVKAYLQDAYDSGILSLSHRSKEFDAMSLQTLSLLRQKLQIPSDYSIMYTGSSTENWEIISQDLIQYKSAHFYNGEFGKKWFEYAKYIHPASQGFGFNENSILQVSDYPVDKDVEALCFTLNETSTGTQVSPSVIAEAKKSFPQALVAIDTTSCLGGIHIDFSAYDVVYGSVQKCFGLPAGLGLLICSPKAIAKANAMGIRGRYNSLLRMHDHIQAYQTSYTPNVLGIYLLSRVLETISPIVELDRTTTRRAGEWYGFVPTLHGYSLHIHQESVRSHTVITVAASEDKVSKLKSSAKAAGFDIGSGYGPLKNSTFRIANFPSITDEEISSLKNFLAHL